MVSVRSKCCSDTGCKRLTRGAYLAYSVWVAVLQLRVEYSRYDVGCEVRSGELPKVAGPLQRTWLTLSGWRFCSSVRNNLLTMLDARPTLESYRKSLDLFTQLSSVLRYSANVC